jgi:hypothetical protein
MTDSFDWPPGSGKIPEEFDPEQHTGVDLDVMYIKQEFGPFTHLVDLVSHRVAGGLVMLANDLMGLVLDGEVDMVIDTENLQVIVNGVQGVPLAHILHVSLTDPENADISVFFDFDEEEEDAETGEG